MHAAANSGVFLALVVVNVTRKMNANDPDKNPLRK